MTKARVIRVDIEPTEAGILHATSPDVKGFLVAGFSLDDTKANIKVVLEALLSARGQPSVVHEAEASGPAEAGQWVIVPHEAVSSGPLAAAS